MKLKSKICPDDVNERFHASDPISVSGKMIYKSCQTLVATKHYLESLSFVSRISWWKFSNLLLLFELQSVYLCRNVAVFSSSSNISSQKLSDNADWAVWQVSDKCSKLSSQARSLSVGRSLLEETSRRPDISQVPSFPAVNSAKTVSKRSRFWRLEEKESPVGDWGWLLSRSALGIWSTESRAVGKLKPISVGGVRWGFSSSSSCLILLKLYGIIRAASDL